jgi:hypothetical protein
MRLGVPVCAVLGLGLGPALGLAAAQTPLLRYAVRVEAGAEYDSNPARVEHIKDAPPPPEVPASPLGRLVLSGDLAAAPGTRHLLAASATAAVKAFTDSASRAEDVLVGQASGSWNVRLAGRTSIGVAGSYYDVFQRGGVEARDFRSLQPAFRVDAGVGEGGALAGGGGYRWFVYKPDVNFDFRGPSAFLSYRHLHPGAEGTADWEWSVTASVEDRRFNGIRCTRLEACPDPFDGQLRRDQFWVGATEVTRTGAFLAGGGLAVHANQSNSYGEPLVRGVAHLRAVILLPAELSLSLRAELVATRYRDSLPLSRNEMSGTPIVSIEDESRSTARAEVARPLGRYLDAGIRYTFYTNELAAGGPVKFRRHTALLFLAFVAER